VTNIFDKTKVYAFTNTTRCVLEPSLIARAASDQDETKMRWSVVSSFVVMGLFFCDDFNDDASDASYCSVV
jgi:hypothetical protein